MANIAHDSSSDGEMLVVSVFAGCAETNDEWILDTACTFHMCPNRDWFTAYELVNSVGSVLMGDDSACKVAGIGSIRIKMFDETIRTLSNVRYCEDPDLLGS